VRSRLTDLQRGAREGRAAAPWNFGVDETDRGSSREEYT
jgi:hypothetical protein